MSTSTGSTQVVTMTIVPVPKNPAQSSGLSNAAYGSSNAASSAPKSSGTAASATVPTNPAAPVFTGAGAKMGVSGFVVSAVAVVFMLLA